jgi:hypothetical protein
MNKFQDLIDKYKLVECEEPFIDLVNDFGNLTDNNSYYRWIYAISTKRPERHHYIKLQISRCRNLHYEVLQEWSYLVPSLKAARAFCKTVTDIFDKASESRNSVGDKLSPVDINQ